MIDVIVYETQTPLKPDQRFFAFLVQEIEERDAKRVKTGNKVPSILPVRFSSATADGARDTALQFWKDETAKAEALRERGRQLGKARAAA
jgi:hypothetical protein